MSNPQYMEDEMPDDDLEFFKEYTDEELVRAWNSREKLTLTSYVERQMDYIDNLLSKRGVIAWNGVGQITERREQ
jgi:hypothetical protein